MKKLYDKNQLTFSLVWIGAYVVLLSLADGLSEKLGVVKSLTAPLCVAMSAFLYLWLRKEKLTGKYGLGKSLGKAKPFLYFIPLVLLASTNLWWGVKLNYTVAESVLYVISMLCVGFLEELIFRGLLFTAMCKDSVKTAVIVSSVTFGVGHIVNLLNGSPIPQTLMQICYATAVGFLFTILFYKTGNLWPCILTHSVVNSLSAFANEESMPPWGQLVGGAFMCVVALAYAGYILRTDKKEKANA